MNDEQFGYDDTIQKYVCSFCGKMASNQRGIRAHLQRANHAPTASSSRYYTNYAQDGELPFSFDEACGEDEGLFEPTRACSLTPSSHEESKDDGVPDDDDHEEEEHCKRDGDLDGKSFADDVDNIFETLRENSSSPKTVVQNSGGMNILVSALDLAERLDLSEIFQAEDEDDDDFDCDATGAEEEKGSLEDEEKSDEELLVKEEHIEVSIEALLKSIGLLSEEELACMHTHVTKGISFGTSQVFRDHMISHIKFSDKTILRKDVKNIYKGMERRILKQLLAESEENMESAFIKSGIRLQRAVATFPNADLAVLMGLQGASVTVEHVEWDGLLKQMLADSLVMVSRKRDSNGGMKLPFSAAPTSASVFEADTDHTYADYYSGMQHFKSRRILRRLHLIPTLEIFGLIVFIDGTQLASFKNRKVVPIYIATTLQPHEQRKIYHFGYIPVFTAAVAKVDSSTAAEISRYWRTRILDAVLSNFDPINQNPRRYSVSLGKDDDEASRIPLIPHIAMIVSDYVEGCDLSHFKSTAAGLRPCRNCLVRKGMLYDTENSYTQRDCNARFALWSGDDIPVTLAEFKARETKVAAPHSIDEGVITASDDEIIEEKRNRITHELTIFKTNFVLKLGVKSRLKQACEARGIFTDSSMTKSAMADALLQQKKRKLNVEEVIICPSRSHVLVPATRRLIICQFVVYDY